MNVLSHFQAKPMLEALKSGSSVETSLDLNITRVELRPHEGGFDLGEATIGSSELKRIAKDENGCFVFLDGDWHKIQAFSEDLQRPYSLFPTERAPTMRVAGFPMHRIKDIDPWEDTRRKIVALGSFHGSVLDTNTGLGYTAIAASEVADSVTTIELDPTALKIASYNPWSQPLFEREKIHQLLGDSFEVVRTLPSGQFDALIHDPPTKQLAGELYSFEFYQELRRVLTRKGRLFHYIGDLESPYGTATVEGVVRRLREAGFHRVERHQEAFGVVAY